MQRGFTKLFSSIVTSTIWAEDDKTRIVFITMLAIADAHGEVSGSIPGLANLARVELDACERALARLESPDVYSRTKTDEGRRIRQVDGGWQIINYAKYRGMLSAEERREYKRIKQQEYRQRDLSTVSTSGQAGHKQKQKQKQRAEALNITPDGVVAPAAPGDDRHGRTTLPGMPDEELPFQTPEFVASWADYCQHRRELRRKLTPTATKAALRELAKMGAPRAIAALRHTIARGWQGIQEPDTKGNRRPAEPAKSVDAQSRRDLW